MPIPRARWHGKGLLPTETTVLCPVIYDIDFYLTGVLLLAGTTTIYRHSPIRPYAEMLGFVKQEKEPKGLTLPRLVCLTRCERFMSI